MSRSGDRPLPHVNKMLFKGGPAREYERERAARMGYADRTRRYDKDYRHYYGQGEAGFSRGGTATRRAREPEAAQAKHLRVAKLIDQIWARNAALERARR